MCGILAISKKGALRRHAADVALAALSLRGPDDHGVFEDDDMLLGHTRLSIIDIDGGHQPMTDKVFPYTIVFNGEIYNYKELRIELEKKGHRFSTDSDTETILKAYAEYGRECPKHLDGMFAFALWDAKKKELFMARDRFGKKPLYYARNERGEIVAASEIKALIAAGIKGKLDLAAMDEYLTLMYVPPWRTIYTNVHVLPPAHAALFTNDKLSVERYWELSRRPVSISYGEAKEEVRRLFDEAVKKRMVADVEIGAFLSGGVDSTLVTAYAQKYATHPLKTFSLGYGDYINELPFAEEASRKIGTDHHTLEATAELTHELEKVLAYFDEPHGDSSDFPQHLVSELASRKVKVALSGDGGDELFLGYGWYFAYWNRPKLIQLKNALFSNPFAEHLKSIAVFSETERRALWKKPPVPDDGHIDRWAMKAPGDGIEKMNCFDITTYLPGQLLTKVDQMSMMHSLEVRSPLLDYRLAEFVYNLPEQYKTDRKTGKIILKDLLREIMPNKFVDRKKQGFGAPVRKWLQEQGMRSYIEKRLGKGARIYSFLDENTVKELTVRAYRRQNPKPFYQLWVLLCLELWLNAHEERHAF